MTEKNWFEEWFNSPYYHILYENRSETEAENFIKKISTFLQIKKEEKILDAACGKGRHARTLASLGFDVTGVDLSKNNIAYARQFENERLRFAVHDIRELYREKGFHFVFNLFSSFGYCDDDAEDYRIMLAFAGNLCTGGRLILDYINTEWAVKNIKPREIIQRGDIQFHIQKRIENGFIRKKIEFLAGGENHNFEEQLKIINLFKFEKMLREAGLKLKNVFGDYDLNKFNPADSPRLILIAQKE